MPQKAGARKALVLVAATISVFFLSGHGAGAARLTDCRLESDRMVVTLHSGGYRVVDGDQGQRIKMEGYGYLMAPGVPMLPMKRFLVALPPGAVARSVGLLGCETAAVPGVYRIAPFSGIMFLPGMPRFGQIKHRLKREWRAAHDAVYLVDSMFPEEPVWLAGRVSLRKYSYATVAFCPFTYNGWTAFSSSR